MNFCEKLSKFFSENNSPVLFAGAGVSASAGLPTWGNYIERLARYTQPDDPMTCHHMIEKAHEKDFLGAASLYFLSKKIPQPRKYQRLAEPLLEYDINKIKAIPKLPFSAYITTNYDRVLLDLYANEFSKPAFEVNLYDPTLASAQFNNNFYVARIHGRIEAPETMMLSDQHYEDILDNDNYIDYLIHCFTHKSIVFVGFSFLDPAIKQILEVVEKKFGKTHLGNHIAIIPENSDAEFTEKLELFGISRATYGNNHAELWECLESIADALSKTDTTTEAEEVDPFKSAKQFLSTCYARTKLKEKLVPLKHAIIEGLVSHYIQKSNAIGITLEDIVLNVHESVKLSTEAVEPLVKNSIRSLMSENLCEHADKDGVSKIFWTSDNANYFELAINTLVSGTIDRYIVREGGLDTESNRKCLGAAYNMLIVSRGWDLGAAFASNSPPEDVDVSDILMGISLFDELDNRENLNGLARAIEDVLRHPNADESKLLSDLGRMSFALELVMSKPNSTLVHEMTLPERIYLDANVLMPAVTLGHPYHAVYNEVIDRLLHAATHSRKNIQIITYYGFLNEVVSHKRIASRELEHLDENIKDTLRADASYYGVENMNVFVGSYANMLLKDKDLSFNSFLKEHAPYNTEKELKTWLERKGITVYSDNQMKTADFDSADILHTLEIEYAGNIAKTGHIIQHDSVQLAKLRADSKNGIRSIFVSADRKLRQVISNSDFSHLGDSMISHIGLAQLIDLLVGVDTSDYGFEGLYWMTNISSSTERVRNYLIDQALRDYDGATAMSMHKIVDYISDELVNKAEHEGVSLNPKTPEEKSNFRKFISSFEDYFFAEMRKLIERD